LLRERSTETIMALENPAAIAGRGGVVIVTTYALSDERFGIIFLFFIFGVLVEADCISDSVLVAWHSKHMAVPFAGTSPRSNFY
jgi:hypothetical protein